MTVFETTGHVALRVSLAGGAVEIETTEQPRVEIQLVPLRDNDVTRKAIAEARIEMIERGARHEIVVGLGKGAGFGFLIGRGAKVGSACVAPGVPISISAPARPIWGQSARSAPLPSRLLRATSCSRTWPGWRSRRPAATSAFGTSSTS